MLSKFHVQLYSVVLSITLLCGCTAISESANANSLNENQESQTYINLNCISKSNLPFGGSGSKDGYYTMSETSRQDGSTNILYSDYQSQRTIYLCNQANCTHDSSSCTSWVPFSGGGTVPLVVGERLVLAYFGNTAYAEDIGERALPRFEIMDLSGANRHLLKTLQANQELKEPFITDGSALYFVVRTYTEQGYTDAFTRLSLDNAKMDVLWFLDSPHEIVRSAFENYVATIRYDENSDVQELCMRNWDTGEMSLVKKWETDQVRYILLGSDFIYVQQQGEDRQLHKTNLLTGEDIVVSEHIFEEVSLLDVWVSEYQDNHIIVCENVRDDSGVIVEVKAQMFDINNGSSQNWSLLYKYYDSYATVSIAAEILGKDCYFVLANESEPVEGSQVSEDGIPLFVPSPQRTFGIISATDYWESENTIKCFDRIA